MTIGNPKLIPTLEKAQEGFYMLDKSWENFATTGHVTDYLDYRRQESGKEQTTDAVRGGQKDGTEHSDDRNDTFGYAHW